MWIRCDSKQRWFLRPCCVRVKTAELEWLTLESTWCPGNSWLPVYTRSDFPSFWARDGWAQVCKPFLPPLRTRRQLGPEQNPSQMWTVTSRSLRSCHAARTQPEMLLARHSWSAWNRWRWRMSVGSQQEGRDMEGKQAERPELSGSFVPTRPHPVLSQKPASWRSGGCRKLGRRGPPLLETSTVHALPLLMHTLLTLRNSLCWVGHGPRASLMDS